MNFYTGLNILASLPKYSQMEEELDLITFLQLMGNALSLINIYLDISANDDADEIDEDDADLELEILGFFQLLLASLNLFQVIIQHQDIAFFDEIRTAFIELLAPNEEVPRQPINFWPRLAARRSLFWWMTGFVPETLQEIVQEVAHDVRQPRNPAAHGIQETELSVRNRVLMAFIWMRQYPTVIHLAEMFGVDKATVSLEIHHVIPILRFHLQNEIVWMSMEEAQVLRGSWPSFPNAVFALDATIHPVWKPLIHQSWYYRGDKKRHCLITQIIVSPAGVVINMEAGYLGTNDTGAYNLSEFGQGNYGLPDWARGLADGGYPQRLPLLVPYRKPALQGNPERRVINRWHRFYRSVVERTFRKIKVFRCCNATWRHPKYFQGTTTYTVGCVTNIKMRFERQIREHA